MMKYYLFQFHRHKTHRASHNNCVLINFTTYHRHRNAHHVRRQEIPLMDGSFNRVPRGLYG